MKSFHFDENYATRRRKNSSFQMHDVLRRRKNSSFQMHDVPKCQKTCNYATLNASIQGRQQNANKNPRKDRENRETTQNLIAWENDLKDKMEWCIDL
jgi:hypothetical protein